MFYEKSMIEEKYLRCDKCEEIFDGYSKPRIIPCGKTVCSECITRIEKSANTNTKKFKCVICLKEHSVPDDGFPLNEKIYDLLVAEPMEISRGQEYEKLKINLDKIELLAKILMFDGGNGIDMIKKHCLEQIRLIQLSTETKIEQINKLNDELIELVKQYENKCIQAFLDKNEKIQQRMNNIIYETNVFLKEKQDYLKQYQIDEEEIKLFNKAAEDLQSFLKEKRISLKKFIFDNKLIKFQSNINEIVLGNMAYISFDKPLKFLISASPDKIIQWDLEKNQPVKTFDDPDNAIKCIKKTIDNKFIISGCFDGIIKIWDFNTNKCIKTIKAHIGFINSILLVSSDRFASCSIDKEIKLFDLNTYECIKIFIGHSGEVNCLDFISEKNLLVSCSNDRTIRIWDLNLGDWLKVLDGTVKSISCVKVLSNENLISCSFNEITVWNIESGLCFRKNIGHSNWIRKLALVSNEKIATCDEDGVIIISELNSGECLKLINAHSGTIWFLVKLSDEKIASCSKDKTIKVWDINTGVCLKTLNGHKNQIKFFKF